MPIKIRCACGNVLLAPEDRVGEVGKCPNCNRSIKVEMPRSSDTKKLLPHPENETKEDASLKHFTLRRKPSWIRRILSFPVYTVFLLLLLFVISIQSFSEAKIIAYCNQYVPDEIWLQEQILLTRNVHRNFFLTKIYSPLLVCYKKIYPDSSVPKEEEKKKELLDKQQAPEKQESPLKPEKEEIEKKQDSENKPEMPNEPEQPEKE